jgi:putative phosphoesterase
MKIAVFSDSHREISGIDDAFAKIADGIDAVIHLGDGYRDMEIYKHTYPEMEFYCICGNCDLEMNGTYEMCFELAGKQFFITHGHMYGVKSGYQKIISAAKNKSADICLFGHTHKADIFNQDDILFINPGSINMERYFYRNPTFVMLEIKGDDVVADIIAL